MDIRKLIRETLEKNLSEIDTAGDFSDVKFSCLSPAVVVRWLNDELDRLNFNRDAPQKDTIKRGNKDIIMSRKGIESIMDDDRNINLNMFIRNLTMEPDSIFDHNPKMEKSDEGRPQLTVNTGLPAIVGIVYDMEHEKFYSVPTCPSAGECQIGCYARKAFYGMDDSKIMKLTRRLNLLLNDPEKYKQMIFNELEPIAKNLKTSSIGMKDKIQLVIRWNDAGDFFGQKYFNIARDVTRELLKRGYNVKSYAYTKRSEYVIELDKDKNFVINFSTDAHSKDIQKMKEYDPERNKAKYSHKVGVASNLFKDIFEKKGPHYVKGYGDKPIFTSEEAPEILKDRIYEKYKDEFKFTRDSLAYTFELPVKIGKPNKYNVIVLPTGDSDIGAQREDVGISFLLEH